MANGSLDLGELCVDEWAVPVAFAVVFDKDLERLLVTIARDQPSVPHGQYHSGIRGASMA